MTPTGHIAVLIVTVISQLPHDCGAGDTSSCNQTLTAPRGEIRSPNYPQPYPTGVTCLWHIIFGNVSNVTGITLAFKHFSTQTTNSGALFVEELLIYENNPSDQDSRPHIYRGNHSVYQSQRNELWLKFTSSNNTIARDNSLGFDIIYSAVIHGETCREPDTPQHTIRVGINTYVGSYIEYNCSAGYRQIGVSVIVCVLNNGVPTWSDSAPSCVDTCPVPTLNNGNVDYTLLYVNSTVTFTCNSPYILQGNNLIRCSTDNHGLPSWNRDFPQCIIPDCSSDVILDQNTGAIVNPGYSTHSVQAGKNCVWKITVKSGFVVRLFFRYFDLPSDQQISLEVDDVGDERKVLLIVHAGGTTTNVTSTSSRVEILYHGPRANSTRHAGFYIQYEMTSSLGQGGHATFTPVIPTVTTTPAPPTTHKLVTTYEDDGTGTIKIALGVAVPVVILLAVSLGLYLWYRKKYPVRMIIGREFAKFSNPEYNVKGQSTLTLVRDDAEDFFNTASRPTSIVNLVVDREQGPHYVNMAFRKDENGELHAEENQPIDQDKEDEELRKRKSYLFTTNVDIFDETDNKKDGDSSSDSDSGSDDGSGSQASRKTQDVVVTVEHEQDVAVDVESPAKQSYISQSDIDSFNSHSPNTRIRKTSVGVLLERAKYRRAFTNEERPVRRFSFDASLSVRGRSLSAKTPAEVSKEADKLDALLSRCNFSKEEDSSTLEEANDTSEKPMSDADVDNDEKTGEERGVSDDHGHENKENERSGAYENVTVRSDSVTAGDKTAESVESNSCQKSGSQDSINPEHKQDDDSVPTAIYENVLVSENESFIEETPKRIEILKEVTQNDTNGVRPVSQSTDNKEDSSSESDVEDSKQIPHGVQDKEMSDIDDKPNPLSEEDMKNDDSSRDSNKEESAHSTEADSSHATNMVPESEKSTCKDDNTAYAAKPTSDDSEIHTENASEHPIYENGEYDSESAIHYENAVFVVKSTPDDDSHYENTEFTPRPKSVSLNETDISGNDSMSVASTSSHVSGSYNFGQTPPESSEEEGEEEEEEQEKKHEKGEEKEENMSSTLEDQQKEHEMATSTISATKEDDLTDRDSDVSGSEIKSENKTAVNLDTSSISSLDQSVLDTSVDLSSASDSPVMQKRLSASPTSSNPPKKVAAPVFNIGDDDDDDDDASSDESDEEDPRRKRESRTSATVMPGIEEESDSDEGGHSRSYNLGGGGDDDTDSGGEGGRKFTDDDLLGELSDESSNKNTDKLSPGMFVFDQNKDDDLDV